MLKNRRLIKIPTTYSDRSEFYNQFRKASQMFNMRTAWDKTHVFLFAFLLELLSRVQMCFLAALLIFLYPQIQAAHSYLTAFYHTVVPFPSEYYSP